MSLVPPERPAPMTEAQELKAQLCAVLSLSSEVAAESDPISRRHGLGELQRAIQGAKPVLETYAVDLLVELD